MSLPLWLLLEEKDTPVPAGIPSEIRSLELRGLGPTMGAGHSSGICREGREETVMGGSRSF